MTAKDLDATAHVGMALISEYESHTSLVTLLQSFWSLHLQIMQVAGQSRSTNGKTWQVSRVICEQSTLSIHIAFSSVSRKICSYIKGRGQIYLTQKENCHLQKRYKYDSYHFVLDVYCA